MTDDDLRDSFGEELTEALRIRSRTSAATDIPLAAPSRTPRIRTRTRVLAAALAATIVASGIAVAVFHSASSVHVATTPSSTTPPTAIRPLQPNAAGVADWTWVSVEQGWALVRTRCGSTVCLTLRATHNGGRTWTTVRTPKLFDSEAQSAASSCATRVCAVGVRFATSRIGWLFGPAFLETTDGGRTWKQVPGPDVIDVEASQGVAVRLTTADWATCGPACTSHVERKRFGATAWQPVTTPLFASPSLIILGSNAYVVSVPNLAGGGLTELRRSTDGGKTWAEMADPCTIGGSAHITTSASAAPERVFVVLCSARQPPISPFVRISTDGGKTFGPRKSVPFEHVGVVRVSSAQTLAVADSTNGAQAVLISRDGGVTWHTTLRPPPSSNGAVTLGWETGTTARVSFGTDAIWTTRDAGLDWTANPVAP